MKRLFLSLHLISLPAIGSDIVRSCPVPESESTTMIVMRPDSRFPLSESTCFVPGRFLVAEDSGFRLPPVLGREEAAEKPSFLEKLPPAENEPKTKGPSAIDALIGTMQEKYRHIVDATVRSSSSITAEMIYAVMWVESKGKPSAVSPKGAQGVMQINAVTRRELGLRPGEAFEPRKAIPKAARYLEENHAAFGDWYSAILAYGIGPGNARSYLRKNKDPSRHPYVKKVFHARSLM